MASLTGGNAVKLRMAGNLKQKSVYAIHTHDALFYFLAMPIYQNVFETK